VTAEDGQLNKVVTSRLQELPLAAQVVDPALALVAFLTETNDKHLVFRDALAVQVDDMMMGFDRRSANTLRIVQRERVTVAALGRFHAALRCLQSPRAIPHMKHGTLSLTRWTLSGTITERP
jgi:hypothetical protein